MDETLELRVLETHAPRLFAADEGERLGFIRRVKLSLTDPRVARVAELQKELHAQGSAFFFGWNVSRTYSERELRSAEAFLVLWRKTIETAGEDGGTIYDDDACVYCGSGATQRGPLVLERKRLPKTDFAITMAGETLASGRARMAFESEKVAGVRFDPLLMGARQIPSDAWFQFRVATEATMSVVPPTIGGDSPFELDDTGAHKCPTGHLLGLNRLSELYVDRRALGEADCQTSRQFFGIRRGYFRPSRLLVVMPRVRELVLTHRLKGWNFEVARVVP